MDTGAAEPAPETTPDPAESTAGSAPETTPEPPETAAEVAPEIHAQPRELSDRDRRLLTFERQRWRYAGAKEQAIRETFDISATRYYQILSALIDRPEAMEHDPMLVKRLRRLRANRQRDRAARRIDPQP